MRLAGKTFLVTGGARRIGAAIVRALAQEGASVVVHCNRSLAEAEALAAAMRAPGRGAWAAQADFSEADAGDRLFDAALDATGGRLDGIVNSASEYRPATLESLDAADLERQMRIHVAAPLALLRRLAAMPGDGAKAAVNILDARIAAADPAHAAYLLSKQALAALTQTLARSLAPRLRLNAVAPGAVLQAEGEPEGALSRLAAFNPMKSCGSPAGLAKCVLFLLQTDFVAGQTLYYDGGYHLKAGN